MGNFLRLCKVFIEKKKKKKKREKRKTAFSCCSVSAHVRPESQERGWEGAWSFVFFQNSPHSAAAPQSPRKSVRGGRGPWAAAQGVLCTQPAATCQTAAPCLCPLPGGCDAAAFSMFLRLPGFQPAAPCPKRVGGVGRAVSGFCMHLPSGSQSKG